MHALLRRYGVVFWRMLQREAGWLPPWRDLLRVLRRLEARGDIRGGRFVAGVSGEQFALPEAVKLAARHAARAARRPNGSRSAAPIRSISSARCCRARKIPALTGNRVLYRDGVAVAALVSGELQWFETLDLESARIADDMLVRRREAPAPLPTARQSA